MSHSPGPKPAFRGDPWSAADLSSYERELRAWEAEVVRCDELNKAVDVEVDADEAEEVAEAIAGTPLTGLSRSMGDGAFEEFASEVNKFAVSYGGGGGGTGSINEEDFDRVLTTDDGNVVVDENGNLVLDGGTRV